MWTEVANYKGWAQQPASIVEFPTGKDGDILNPVIQRAEVQDEDSIFTAEDDGPYPEKLKWTVN